MARDIKTPDAAAKPLRWGILGAARIAGKSLIPAFRTAGAEVLAVAARDKERAKAFAHEQAIPRVHDGYQALLNDPEIEAVYLPLANAAHKEWAIKTAQAGKACLCEKPMALTAEDANAMAEAFAGAGRTLQEAFMWRHHAQVEWVAERIRSGEIGELRIVNAHFSFTLDRPADYRWLADQGGGALWDIGCYGVNAARRFMGTEPAACSARSFFRPGPQGVDESSVAWLDFGGGRFAHVSCSFGAAFAQGIELVGTRARVWIGNPWLQVGKPTKVLIENESERKIQDFEPMNSYVAMIQRFTQAARDPNAEIYPGEDGRAQATVMEALIRSSRDSGAQRGVESAIKRA